MAQRKSDSSEHSLHERIGNIENLLSQLLEEKKNLSGMSSSPAEESNGNRSENKSPRKRSVSVDGDEGGKRKRSERAIFECTLCDGKYQKEWILFRHYRVSHGKQSPERVHQENLAKRARMKNSSDDKSNKEKPGNKPEKEKNCKLCEAAFNSTSARNSHYTGKHQIKDEKLLFFPNGSALVESSLEYLINKNPQVLKRVVKRNMPSRVCKLCEVELDMDDLKYHYEKDHKVMQMSKIKTLIRLNKDDIEQLANTKCSYCSDTFTDTRLLENHVATVHTAHFTECKICNKSFELKIYNDHVKTEHKDVYFKKDDVSNTPTKVTEPNKSATEKKDADETEKRGATVSARRVSFKPQSRDVPLMYICDACNLVTSSYDNAIAHSQEHILNKVTKEPEVCEICDLKFDADFAIHKQMHLIDPDLDRDSFRFVSYDFKNLTNDKWLEMFSAFTKSKVNRIVSASIYFSTRCIRLKLLRDCKAASAEFTLFQCLTCKNYVDPKDLESHVGQRNSCTDQTFSHQCVKCGKTFYSAEASDEHTKTHDVPDSDSRYRTVLFNDPSDIDFNKALLENGGKGALFKEKPEKRVIDEDVAPHRPKDKVTVVTSETNKENPEIVMNVNNKVGKGHKVEIDVKNKVANQHKGGDGANKVANERKMTNEAKAKKEKEADVYKCSCGLCFDRFDFLLRHMQNCSTNTTKMAKITCECGLVFDRQNFVYHCKAHCRGITIFNVKRLTIEDEMQIDVSGLTENFKKDIKKILMKAIDEVKKQNNNDVNSKPHEKVSKQINSANKEATPKQVPSENNVLIQTKDVSKYSDKLEIVEKEHEIIHDVNVKEAGSEINQLYQPSKKDVSESNGKTQNVNKMVNSKNFEVREVKQQIKMKTDVLNDISKSKKLRKNSTLVSENTQENNSMVETTIEVEFKENSSTRTFISKTNSEEQPKSMSNESEKTNERLQITTQISDVKHKIEETNKNTNVAAQEITNDDGNCSNAQDGKNTSHVADELDIDDYDEEELLKDPESDVNDSLMTDDDDEDHIGSGIALIKKKITSLFQGRKIDRK